MLSKGTFKRMKKTNYRLKKKYFQITYLTKDVMYPEHTKIFLNSTEKKKITTWARLEPTLHQREYMDSKQAHAKMFNYSRH